MGDVRFKCFEKEIIKQYDHQKIASQHEEVNPVADRPGIIKEFQVVDQVIVLTVFNIGIGQYRQNVYQRIEPSPPYTVHINTKHSSDPDKLNRRGINSLNINQNVTPDRQRNYAKCKVRDQPPGSFDIPHHE